MIVTQFLTLIGAITVVLLVFIVIAFLMDKAFNAAIEKILTKGLVFYFLSDQDLRRFLRMANSELERRQRMVSK